MLEEEIIVIEDETEEEIVVLEEAIEKIYPELQNKIVIPTTEEQKIKADSGIYGLNEITVEPVTNEIDDDIKTENIKSGITILGVEGNVVELVGEEITIAPKSQEQEIVPTAPINAFTKVKVGAQTGVDINDYFKNNGFSNPASGKMLWVQSLLRLPDKLDLSGVTDLPYAFQNYKGYNIPELINVPQAKRLYYAFSGDENIETIPFFDTSKVEDWQYTFYDCKKLKSIPNFDFSSATNINSLFKNCFLLEEAPDITSENLTTVSEAFYGCSKLKKAPSINMSQVTSIYNLFRDCSSLEEIPQYDTSNATNCNYAFYRCSKLKKIAELDFSSMINVNNMFYTMTELTELGGFKDFGKGFLTTANTNNYNYKISFTGATKITHDSGLNILNKLYDIASAGVNPQTISLPYQTLQALRGTEEGLEAIANANAKGWTVSS